MQTFNAAISRLVTWILWTSPVGVASLIAAAICRTCSLGATLAALALWVVTVLAGLVILGGLVLPGILLVATRGAASPLKVAGSFGRALALAFGTSSSSAALPVSSSVFANCIYRIQVTKFKKT